MALTREEVAGMIRELFPYIINPMYLAPKGSFKGHQEASPGRVIEYDSALMPNSPKAQDRTEAFKVLVELYTQIYEEDQYEPELLED